MSQINLTQEQYEALPDSAKSQLEKLGVTDLEALNHIDSDELIEFFTPEDFALLSGVTPVDQPEEKSGGLFGGGKKKDKGEGKKKERQPDPEPEPVQPSGQVVTVISRDEDRTLVQWQEDQDFYRVYVPAGAVSQSLAVPGLYEVDPDVLGDGEAYGDDWESIAEDAFTVTPQDIARALRGAGIWTVADLMKAIPQAQGAFNAAHGRDFAHFVNAVRKSINSEE